MSRERIRVHHTIQSPKIPEALTLAVASDLHTGPFDDVMADFRNADAILVPDREGYFTVTVDAAVNEPFFAWLCTFGDGVRILAPDSAVRAMEEHIRAILARYTSTKEE